MKKLIKVANNFDGFELLLEGDEFDSIMVALDMVAEANKEYPAYKADMEKTREAIKEYSYFDINERSVRTRLSSTELTCVIEALSMSTAVMAALAGKNESETFDSMIQKEGTKIWR